MNSLEKTDVPRIEPMLNVPDVSLILKCSTSHIRREARKGDLVGIKIGKGKKADWRFKISEVSKYIDKRTYGIKES